MGIKSFFKSLLEKSDTKIDLPEHVSGFMIDLNDILHLYAAKTYRFKEYAIDLRDRNGRYQKAKFDSTSDEDLEEEFIQGILDRLDIYLSINPTDYFIVVVDGPAPLSKIAQQRDRRLTFPGVVSPRFDSSMLLSPGTPIMSKIHERLNKWFYDRASEDKLPPFSCYSSYHEPGEGEHKMIQIFLDNLEKIPFKHKDGYHMLASQDSDILMLGMTIPLKNVVFWREDRETEAKTNNITPELYSIDKFRSRIVSKNYLRDNINEDFILMYFLFGNDFFPKSPGMSKADEYIEKSSQAYIKNGRRLVNTRNNNIIRSELINFFKHLTPYENYGLQTKARTYNHIRQRPFPILTDSIIKNKDGSKTLNIDAFKHRWYRRAMEDYNKLNGMTYTDLECFKKDMMENYITTLQWNLDYYMRRDIAWNHQYKFPFAPFISDLAMLPSEGQVYRVVDDWKSKSSILRQLIMITHPNKLKLILPGAAAALAEDPDYAKYNRAPLISYEDGIYRTPKDDYQIKTLLPMVYHPEFQDLIDRHEIVNTEERLHVNFHHPDVFFREVEYNETREPAGSGGVAEANPDEYIPGSHTKVLTVEKYIWTEDMVE